MFIIKYSLFLRFLKLDSDDDEYEEELTSKREWKMVERKENGTRYSMGPATRPQSHYIGRGSTLERIDLVLYGGKFLQL